MKTKNNYKQFGAIAIEMGFVSKEELEAALKQQKEMNTRGEHKLIGMIMLDMGYIDTAQLLDILKYYEEHNKDA